MLAYLIKSLLQGLLVLLVVALLAFSMFRFVGDPVASLAGQEATQADRAELTERLGLNDPVIVQFGRFALSAASGNFGISYRQGRPVSALIAERLPATVELAFFSALFAVVAGVGLGVYAAVRRNGLIANLVMSLSLVGVSLPTFLIGIGLSTSSPSSFAGCPPSGAARRCASAPGPPASSLRAASNPSSCRC